MSNLIENLQANIEFKVVTKNNQIVTGLFFKNGQPVVYGHYYPNKTTLYLCYKEGESNHYLHKILADIASNETGVSFDRNECAVTEQNEILNNAIEAYQKGNKVA